MAIGEIFGAIDESVAGEAIKGFRKILRIKI